MGCGAVPRNEPQTSFVCSAARHGWMMLAAWLDADGGVLRAVAARKNMIICICVYDTTAFCCLVRGRRRLRGCAHTRISICRRDQLRTKLIAIEHRVWLSDRAHYLSLHARCQRTIRGNAGRLSVRKTSVLVRRRHPTRTPFLHILCASSKLCIMLWLCCRAATLFARRWTTSIYIWAHTTKSICDGTRTHIAMVIMEQVVPNVVGAK